MPAEIVGAGELERVCGSAIIVDLDASVRRLVLADCRLMPFAEPDPERTVDDLQSGHRSGLQQLIVRARPYGDHMRTSTF